MSSAIAAKKPPPSAVSAFISAANTKSPREALAFEILHNLRYQQQWTDLKVHSLSTPTPTSTSSPSQDQPNRTQSPTRSDYLTPTATATPPSPTTLYSRKTPSHNNSTLFLISGLPPRNLYIHPDLQKRLLREGIDEESSLQLQREWVLPMSIGEKWTLKRFCLVFDALPEREPVRVVHVAVPIMEESSQHEQGQKQGSEDQGDDGGESTSASTHQSSETTAAATARNATESQAAATERSVDFTWQDRKRVLMAMLAHNGMGGDGTIAYYIMQEGEVKPRQNG